MSSETEAYALLVMQEVQQPQPEKQALFLPLTLAYLLSEHIRFLFPMPEANARLVDAAFDDLLKGLALKSKGIAYLKNCASPQEYITRAQLILTTDGEVEEFAQANQLPCIGLGQNAPGDATVRPYFLHKINADDLRAQALGCTQLISVLSGGVLSKGHFSLSW
jgi:hypothetical protein